MPPAGRHVFYGKKPCRRFTHSTHYNIRSRAGRAPPLRKKAFPLRGKVARYAPDEGRMSGNRNFPPHQSPSVTASPKGGSLSCGLPVTSHFGYGCNGRHICRPYGLTRYIHYNIRSRAGLAPPLPGDVFFPPFSLTSSGRSPGWSCRCRLGFAGRCGHRAKGQCA